MKTLFILITLALAMPPISAREQITKIGTSKSEVKLGEHPDWDSITVFYKRKAYTVSIKPGSKVDILRDYIGALSQESPKDLAVNISVMEDTDSATRGRRIRKVKRTLTADELDKPIEEIGASVFTITKDAE